jgi:hypothetical protein
MRVDVFSAVPPELLEAAWQFYRDTFHHLRIRAVQRHVLHRHEFDELMADDRVLKYVACDGDVIGGLSAMTDDLAAVPLISPEYFAHRWPGLYEQRRILYCLFVGVAAGPPGKGVFVALQDTMYKRQVGAVSGIAVLDICTYNEEKLQLPWVIEKIMERIAGGARADRLDNQSYWLYEFPVAS